MDEASQAAVSQISALSRLLLESLKYPTTRNDTDAFSVALEIIWTKADLLENDINALAESVGCEFVDDDRRARMAAMKPTAAQATEGSRS